MSTPKIALCLPGGGATGAMFQIGALAALEDTVEGFDASALDVYLGTSSGASVAAALAGGRPVERMYRAFLDPADVYFPLERKHVFQMDLREWGRTVSSGWRAARHASANLFSRKKPPTPSQLWEELDRLYDSLPAGVFRLDAYERFLETFFVRRQVPNYFPQLPKPLRILAHDLDSGEQVQFGAPGFEHVPVSRACIASMAVPPFFSPVRIGDRHYIDGGAAQIGALEAAVKWGADVLIVVNPMVPVQVTDVPTGHGQRSSVRDKGYMWVANQAIRIGMHAMLEQTVKSVRGEGAGVILIEPDATDGILFMHNPASFSARRAILEYAYKTTRERVGRWIDRSDPAVESAGWRMREQPLD